MFVVSSGLPFSPAEGHVSPAGVSLSPPAAPQDGAPCRALMKVLWVDALPVSGAWHAAGPDTGTPGADTRPPTRVCRRGHGVQSDENRGWRAFDALPESRLKFSSKQQVERKK